MVCADIGHSCTLPENDKWLLNLVSFPVSSLPDNLFLHVFGPDSLWAVLLLNAAAWGIVAVAAALLVLRLKKRKDN